MSSGSPVAASVLAAVGPHVTPVVKMKERVEAFVDNQDHVPSAPAVAAVWPTAGHILLTPKGNATVAAVAGADRNSYRVDEHDSDRPPPWRDRA